jgi:hypothetical protein
MSAMAPSVHDEDVRESLRGPSAVEARESLVYWRSRLDTLPRHRRSARREARAMVVAWEERVRKAELERWGSGWLGAAAGGLAILRNMGIAVLVKRVLRVVLPTKVVVVVLSVVLGFTLLAGVVLGALLAALL